MKIEYIQILTHFQWGLPDQRQDKRQLLFLTYTMLLLRQEPVKMHMNNNTYFNF